MALSSNSIIHFAQEKSSLLGILSDSFRVHYCTEQYELGDYFVSAKVPMVSFCDIPLSQIKDHIGKYGQYGIGLTKEWAVRMGLNPVLYIEPNSRLAGNLGIALEEFLLRSMGADGKPTPFQMALADVLRYVKNYQGDLVRKVGTTKNYRFSDEREWRFAPAYDDAYEMLVSMKEYESDSVKHDASLATLRLDFEPNDIKYIIIRDDTEITEFVDHLRRIKGKRYSYHDVERLTTRLLTAEQITSDI